MTIRCSVIPATIVPFHLSMNSSVNHNGVGGSPADTQSVIATIKAELHAAMNGVASTFIRESGMSYKLCYGVELPRLREIAAEFTPDRRLAQVLWQENIRECKLLAVLLYPSDEFHEDMAVIWADELVPQQTEVAQFLCMELLSPQPYASELAFRWMAEEKDMHQLCAFLILGRLLLQGVCFSPTAEEEFLDQAGATLPTTFLPLRKAVTNALLHLAEKDNITKRKVNQLLHM